jgi:predicted flavoprotein YhiN
MIGMMASPAAGEKRAQDAVDAVFNKEEIPPARKVARTGAGRCSILSRC